MSHDILGSIKGAVRYGNQVRLAMLTPLVVGLSAMVLAFYGHNNLLQLLYLTLNFSVPTVNAPFVLALFGFRGSFRTALIGMGIGALAIWAWNKWVKPTTGIDGTFVCMVANGLAMMAAHYLLPQPASKGWVGPDG